MSNQRFKRFAVVLGLAAAASLSSAGCFAFDEIDKSAALIDKGKPAEAGRNEAAKEEARPKRLEWANVKSLNTGEIDATITRCSISGSITFTRRDDCLAQGGTPAKI